MSSFAGFTWNDGWVMPGDGKHEIKFNKGLQAKQRDKCEKVMAIDPDEETAKEYMRLMYDGVTIDHKDQFFARAMVQPFLHALLQKTQLTPIFTAKGPGQVGISQIMWLISSKFWGVPGGVYKATTFNSEPRWGEYVSGTTFGFVIDDAQNLKKTVEDDLKSMVTIDVNHSRMTKERGIDTDKTLVASPHMAYNRRPLMFCEGEDIEATLSRLYEIVVTTKQNPKNQLKYNKMKDTVPDGYLGAYIIKKYTLNWKGDDLWSRYNFCSGLNKMDTRANTQYKVQMLGGLLMKEIFDISLDLSDTEEIISNSRNVQFDDLFTLIKQQIEEGRKPKKDRARWVDNDIIRGVYKDKKGVLYGAHNLSDLRTKLEQPVESVEALHNLIAHEWSGLHFGKHDDEKGFPKRSIFFPDGFDASLVDKKLRITILNAVEWHDTTIDAITKKINSVMNANFTNEKTESCVMVLCNQGALNYEDGKVSIP
jgi:hypothetical protein